MKLIDHIAEYKANNRNTVEHKFKDNTIFKGGYGIKLHEWLDNIYQDAVFEFKTQGTKNTALLIKTLIGRL